MENDKQLEIAKANALKQFGGKVYTNGVETVCIYVPSTYLDDVDLEQCTKLAGTKVVPIASLDDQFDSLFLISETNKIYLCFLNGEQLTVEHYANSLREAICKTLGTKSYLLWMYRILRPREKIDTSR